MKKEKESIEFVDAVDWVLLKIPNGEVYVLAMWDLREESFAV